MLTCVSSGGHLMGTSLRSFTRTIQHYMKMTLTYWNGKTQWKDCMWVGGKSTNKRVGWTSDQFSKTTHQCKLYYSQFINFVFKFLFCLLRKYTTHTTNTYTHYIRYRYSHTVDGWIYIMCITSMRVWIYL